MKEKKPLARRPKVLNPCVNSQSVGGKMINCTDCDSYNRGKGKPVCLKCAKYKDIILSTANRKTLRIDVIPDTILNDVPDNRAVTILDAVKQLPLDLSAILLMYHVLDANQREIAQHLQISQAKVSKKINFAIDIIKKMTILGDQ